MVMIRKKLRNQLTQSLQEAGQTPLLLISDPHPQNLRTLTCRKPFRKFQWMVDSRTHYRMETRPYSLRTSRWQTPNQYFRLMPEIHLDRHCQLEIPLIANKQNSMLNSISAIQMMKNF